MTKIQAAKKKQRPLGMGTRRFLFVLIGGVVVTVILSTFNAVPSDVDSTGASEMLPQPLEGRHLENAPAPETNGSERLGTCLRSMSELTPEERRPSAGKRHMVQPPADGTVTLVCCRTTAGDLSIAVHSTWAPLGAARFLTMVRSGYFSTKVALMRCVKNFICQFGIAGDPAVDKQYKSSNLPDDPNWLPEGPTHRENEMGVLRFARGYMAYAGGGKNSRSNQLIVALKDNRGLGGGSPWEVPWGELVGASSYDTLSNIYTGYGENGPSQALLHNQGSSQKVEDEFPHLDYVTSCHVMDEETL